VIHCCQLLVCSLPRYMRAYRPLLSCNNCPIVSVAHATLPTEQFGALQLYPRIRNSYPLPGNGYFNSAFQTACHNMNYALNYLLFLALLLVHNNPSQTSDVQIIITGVGYRPVC
jgi:hypothetical protein